MASNVQDDARERPNIGHGRRELDPEGWRERAEAIFKEIPPPPIQPLPKEHAFDLSKYKNQLESSAVEARQQCVEAIEKYDAITCKAHREEIDTLLVFAGLFSAVVTAFTIESYQWLQSDPNDAIIALLSQLAQSGNKSPTFPAPAGLPVAVSARINAYWFLSLTLSLASALVAILCKQWVREFERRGDQTPEMFISVRQTKLEGFEGWGVASVVAAIPLLLQSALGLFALGLIELLWKLHMTVAIVVLVPTLAALIFYGVTALLPGLQLFCDPCGALIAVSQCPFKSPQALLTLRVFALVWRYWSWPWFVYVPFEFCYKHCLVFFRRVYASFSPDYLTCLRPRILPTVPPGDASRDREEHWLWRRLRAPWQYPELKFYEHTTDGPSWRHIRRWWRRHMPSYLQTQDLRLNWRLRMEYAADTIDPASRSSWVVLDRDFTRDRDAAYAYMLAKGDTDQVAPQSYFRGLSWLRAQTDHPGLLQWIWLATWQMATDAEQRPVPLCHGILHLYGHEDPALLSTSSQPIALALAFGIDFDIGHAVMGELFLHVLPYLEPGAAPYIWDLLCNRLDAESDVWRSVLHAILAHLLRVTGPSDHGDRPAFLVMVPQKAQPGMAHSSSLSAMRSSELACVIALRFRELRLRGGDTVDDYRLSSDLVDTILSWPSANQSCQDYSAVVKSTFSAFAMDLDRWLEQSSGEDILRSLPKRLFDAQCRSVYFDLLRPAAVDPSSFAAAEARLIRQLCRMPEMRRVRDYNPGPGGSWGLHTFVMRWPALHDAVFSLPDSTGDTEGDSASISEAGPSSA